MKRAGHPRFYELIKIIEDLHSRKNQNYAKDNDPLSNLKMCEEIGIPAHIGCFIRIQDKYSRIRELLKGKIKRKTRYGRRIHKRYFTGYVSLCLAMFDFI